jgi:hypothetical protein
MNIYNQIYVLKKKSNFFVCQNKYLNIFDK